MLIPCTLSLKHLKAAGCIHLIFLSFLHLSTLLSTSYIFSFPDCFYVTMIFLPSFLLVRYFMSCRKKGETRDDDSKEWILWCSSDIWWVLSLWHFLCGYSEIYRVDRMWKRKLEFRWKFLNFLLQLIIFQNCQITPH